MMPYSALTKANELVAFHHLPPAPQWSNMQFRKCPVSQSLRAGGYDLVILCWDYYGKDIYM